MKLIPTFSLLLVAPSVVAQTLAVGSDIRPRVESGRIVTDSIPEEDGEPISNVRVFGYEFQLDESDPYFLDDPGFSAAADSGLPASQLNFNGLYRLNYWDGSGAVNFGAPPENETLRINRGAANVVVGAGSGEQSGFAIVNISSAGTGHAHLNSFLNGSDGNAIPGDGVVAANGVYFTAIDVGINTGEVQRSKAVYLAYNNGASTASFQSSLNYLLSPLSGDANFDGRVNTLDFNVLAGNFGLSDRHYFGGDFNEDGAVDGRDFNAMIAGFGQTTADAPTAALSESTGLIVPEPAGMWLLLTTFLFLRRRNTGAARCRCA